MATSKSPLIEKSSRQGMPAAPKTPGSLTVEIPSEAVFMKMLRTEVRRTERSGRPFLLALITGDVFSEASGHAMAHQVARAISLATRETDWVGWYEQNETLGIVLTEIGEASDARIQLLSEKISRVITHAIDEEQAAKLRLVIRLFPQHSRLSEDDGWEGDIYRDLHRQEASKTREELIKRAIDICGSLAALLLLSPVFLVIGLLVKLTSRGPVFYSQKRVGQYGKQFNFYKFRSMYINNDSSLHKEYVTQLIEGGQQAKQQNGMYKLMNDPRVTRIGRYIRKSSLDELPQFFNVLRGEMSLVGPRPPLPYEFERYRMWHRRRVLEIRPGLTGLWQVKGRSRTTFDEMVRMDIHYARTRSLWMDLKIILQTPVAMFTGIGAA